MLESELVILPDTIDSNPPVDRLEMGDNERAIRIYSENRKKLIDTWKVEGHSNDVASRAVESGFQNSDSLLYDKAVSNPEAIGMTLDEVKYDRGRAVATVAKYAYLEKAEDIFSKVLLETGNPLKAQRSADVALDYFFNETARIKDPEEQKLRARKLMDDLQVYDEDGMSYGNFADMTLYMQKKSAEDKNIIIPGGDPTSIAVSKTFVNTDADLGFTHRLLLSAANSMIPTVGLEAGGLDWLQSQQRKYEAYKDAGNVNLAETAAGIAGVLIQARLLNKGIGKWSGLRTIGGVSAASYLATSVGLGAIQDIAESQRGIKQQYFSAIDRTDDKKFLKQYMESRGFDLATAVIGANTGSWIESGLFARGMRQLATTRNVGRLITAQWASPVLDTTVDLALDVIGHNSAVALFGQDEPVFTNAQNLQFSFQGKTQEQIVNQIATLYGTRMAARIGSGALNHALTKRNLDVSKELPENTMGTVEWFDKEIDAAGGNRLLAQGNKTLARLTYNMFGNNLGDLDAAFKENRRSVAPDFTTFLRQSGTNPAVSMRNLASLYMVREAQKNWVVSAVSGIIDGRITRNLSSIKPDMDDADVIINDLAQIRKNEVTNVQRQADIKAIGMAMSARLQGQAPEVIQRELDLLFETHKFSEEGTKLLTIFLKSGLVGEGAQGRQSVITEYIETAKKRQQERVSLSTEDKMNFIDGIQREARALLSGTDLPGTVFGITSGVSNVVLRSREAQQTLLEHTDNRLRMITERGDGLLDIIVGGKPQSLNALRTGAGAYLTARAAAGAITQDNAHDQIRGHLQDYITLAVREAGEAIRNVINSNPDPAVLNEQIRTFNTTLAWAAAAYPQIGEIRAQIDATRTVYEASSDATKKAFDSYLKKNAKLTSLINKEGEVEDGKMFTKLLGMMAAGVDEIRYDRFIFNSSVGKTSGITAVEDILKLINEGVTTDVMRRVARSNVGFNIPSAENLDDNPSLWIRDVDGNRHRVIVSGESMRKEIDAGLVYLMGTTSTEINEGMARNIAILLRAAYFKEMALGAPPRNSIHDVITDLETSGAIVRDAVTGDIDVTDINILTARLRQTQSLVRFAIEKASNNYTQANPELRTGKTVTVAASFLDKTATGNVEITYEEAINHLQRRASNIGHNLNAAAAVLASAYDRATAITRLETFINTIAINARGAAGVYIIPPAQLTRIVTRMVDDALDMRGRSTTFDVGEDRLIYTSEFSAGIESVYRDHGHTFVSIDGSKFDSGLSGEQAKLAGVITKDEFEDDEYMLNTHGLVKLQVGGVNAKAVYMKVPDLTGDSAQDKQVLANFWADICCSMQLRIRNRDHFDTMSAPGTPNPMATRYSNAMEAVFRTAEATPPRSRAELNEFTSRLLRNVATAGKNSIDAILTRMGVALDTESPRTKVTTSGGENRLDAVSAALAIETIRLHSFALGSQINTYRSNLSPANLALFDTEYTKMTTAIENAPDGTDLTTIKNDFITAISTLHAAPPPPPVAGAAALPAVVLDPTAMRTALDSVVDNTKRGAHNSYLNVVRHINTIFDNLRGIAGLPVGTALNLDSITNAIRTSQGLSAFMRSGSDLASGVENALYQINRVMQNARSVAENNLLLTQADNQDIIIEGRSLGISNGVEIGNSTIRNEFIEKLREMKESFESVLAPKPGSIDSPRYTTQTVNPKDTKDNLRALQLLGNMLLFGTKFVHAQADIQKRGAGTREVKHLGFSRLAELVDTGKTNMILFDIGLNYVDGLPVGAGLHYLSEDMFEIVDRNGGSKPTLTGDTSLVKCQFAKGNANMTFIKDLVNARNQVRHGRTTIVQVGTRRFRTADELIIVGRNLYYNMNNVEELDASGAVIGRATIPAVKMSFMTLDHDSIKQFSPNFIESTLNIGNGEDGCTHMRMRRAFQSATFSGSMNNSGANTVLDVDTDVLEIRNRQVHSDILRSFMTHRNTSTTYGKDNTISFQGANDDPLTKAYLSNTIRANAGKMLVDIDKTLAPRFLTAQGVKEQMQEMSNAVSNTETSPGVTVVIKNKRFATDVLDVPNSRILVPSKDGSIASTTGSTWPCRADVSDGMIANIAVKIMKDTADNSYYMIDNTGAKVTVSANDLLSDITTLRRTNPAGKQAAAERLMRFCSASANSPIRLMTQGANQAFFINLTRSPNIQKGQGQSLPALITGIINNDDQLAISSALTKINLADFDGDTMSTQDLNIEDIRVMLENTIGGVNKVTDSEILQYLQEQAALSISKNIFTTSLAPLNLN